MTLLTDKAACARCKGTGIIGVRFPLGRAQSEACPDCSTGGLDARDATKTSGPTIDAVTAAHDSVGASCRSDGPTETGPARDCHDATCCECAHLWVMHDHERGGCSEMHEGVACDCSGWATHPCPDDGHQPNECPTGACLDEAAQEAEANEGPRIQRFVCREHGFGVLGDVDDCCGKCGQTCAVVEVIVWPEDMPPLEKPCGDMLHGVEDDPDGDWECSRTAGHTGDHEDRDNGHRWPSAARAPREAGTKLCAHCREPARQVDARGWCVDCQSNVEKDDELGEARAALALLSDAGVFGASEAGCVWCLTLEHPPSIGDSVAGKHNANCPIGRFFAKYPRGGGVSGGSGPRAGASTTVAVPGAVEARDGAILTLHPTEDAELTCIVCGRGECDRELHVYLTGLGAHRRAALGLHSETCTMREAKGALPTVDKSPLEVGEGLSAPRSEEAQKAAGTPEGEAGAEGPVVWAYVDARRLTAMQSRAESAESDWQEALSRLTASEVALQRSRVEQEAIIAANTAVHEALTACEAKLREAEARDRLKREAKEAMAPATRLAADGTRCLVDPTDPRKLLPLPATRARLDESEAAWLIERSDVQLCYSQDGSSCSKWVTFTDPAGSTVGPVPAPEPAKSTERWGVWCEPRRPPRTKARWLNNTETSERCEYRDRESAEASARTGNRQDKAWRYVARPLPETEET